MAAAEAVADRRPPGLGTAVAAFFCLLLLGCGRAAETPPAARPFPAPSSRAEYRLLPGEEHHFALGDLAAGQAIAFHLHQQGVDLESELIGPGGASLGVFDLPSGVLGLDIVCFRIKTPGHHLLRVHALAATAAGAYQLEPRHAEPAALGRCGEAVAELSAALRATAEPGQNRAELFARALAGFRFAGEPFGAALTAKEAGLFAGREGRTAEALKYYAEALELLEVAGETGNFRQTIAVLNLRGLAFEASGEAASAEDSFRAARRLAREQGDPRGEAVALSNLARLDEELGELHAAVARHREVLQLWQNLRKSGVFFPAEEATSRNLLGGALTRLGLFAEARDELGKALALRQQLGQPEPLANTHLALGWLAHLEGKEVEAETELEQAIGLYEQAGRPLGVAAARDRRGSVHQAAGRPDLAREDFRAAVAAYASREQKLARAHAEANLACLEGDTQRLANSSEVFARFGDRAAAAHVAYCRAKVERQKGRPEAALAAIVEALAGVEQLREAALWQGHASPQLDFWQPYEELEIALLMQLDRQHPGRGFAARAFAAGDFRRARRLSDLLVEAGIESRAGVPAELLTRERELQRRLAGAELRLRKLALAETGSGPPRLAEQELRQLLAELEAAQAAIRRASPRFSELRRPAPLTLAQVQAMLEPSTLLLSYVLGNQESWLFLVSRERLVVEELPPRKEIEQQAFRAWEALRTSDQRRNRDQAKLAAAEAGKVLLGKVATQLEGHRLLVVGDGLLGYLPFAALPAGPEGELLVDRFQVVNLPSAAVMQALRQREERRKAPKGELAVIGDAVYSRQDPRLPATRRGEAKEGEDFSPLPNAARETQEILGLVPEESRFAATGFAAKPELLREGRLTGYRILHFAAHGYLDEGNPELSGLALSMYDPEGRPQDGRLRLAEIYSLELPAELVVLAGCRTALTPKAQGKGLVGLTQGFFYAGASRLLVSLWDVDDAATAELMQRFYKALLAEKKTPAEALRQAQRELKATEGFAAPYYWAGFVLEGDWR